MLPIEGSCRVLLSYRENMASLVCRDSMNSQGERHSEYLGLKRRLTQKPLQLADPVLEGAAIGGRLVLVIKVNLQLSSCSACRLGKRLPLRGVHRPKPILELRISALCPRLRRLVQRGACVLPPFATLLARVLPKQIRNTTEEQPNE